MTDGRQGFRGRVVNVLALELETAQSWIGLRVGGKVCLSVCVP